MLLQEQTLTRPLEAEDTVSLRWACLTKQIMQFLLGRVKSRNIHENSCFVGALRVLWRQVQESGKAVCVLIGNVYRQNFTIHHGRCALKGLDLLLAQGHNSRVIVKEEIKPRLCSS